MSDLDKLSHDSCLHEVTHRGGAIWTICDDCGRKWADDMSEHTPGPWTVEPLRGKYYGTVVRLSTDYSLSVWITDYDNFQASRREITQGWNPEEGIDHVEDVRSYATARLIAAAPDLLEALKDLEDAASSSVMMKLPFLNDAPAIIKARKAIAKATGQS